MENRFDHIRVIDASENNLKHVSLDIPKHQMTVFTGVSGSGKSSLALDTIAAQSRRELGDTFPSFVQHYLPKYGRPHVSRIEHLPAAIVIDQKKPAPNQRSTLGTYTDNYTLLRLLFSRVGQPFAGYSEAFSFNHPLGCCPRCKGLGEITELDVHKLVDFDKCLNDPGVIHYVTFEPGQWRWVRYARSGLFDLDKKIRDYTPEELELFLYSPQIKLKNPPPDWPKSAKYEGLIHRMNRSVLTSDEGKLHQKVLEPLVRQGVCPDCGGARLNPKVLACKIGGKNIAEVSAMPLGELSRWLDTVDHPLAVDIRRVLKTRLSALIDIGLDYLTLDRPLATLSGGEVQRCKIAKYINSSLSDLLYVLDEPSVGLHSHDIHRLLTAIRRLRDVGNTVVLVEHHREIIRAADFVVDMGPGPGADGGQVLFAGPYPALLQSDSLTGRLLRQPISRPDAHPRRTPAGWHTLENATLHNLKGVTVQLPLGVLAVVAGVAGSGKSSLMESFCRERPDAIFISQKAIGVSLRSTPATYMDAADEIRKLFAKKCRAKASLFSFNGEGKCPVCGGKGVVVSNMYFMDDIETVCDACGGLRYSEQALSHRVDGLNIAEVMDLSVGQAVERFAGTAIADKLRPLTEVGLSYLHLNQALSTLSGGELQRMKLASHLAAKGQLFILDEPTDGLHLSDIGHMVDLFHRMVDAGNSLFLIEHSLDVIAAADYVIEMGPGGGGRGGELLYAGTPTGLLDCPRSITGPYLRAAFEPPNQRAN